MDTDDLSIDTYNAIIIEAEKFHHDLTLQFGVLSGSCLTEEEYLIKSRDLINDWLENWDIQEVLDEIFYEKQPDEAELMKCLKQILDNIDTVRKIPIEQRKFEKW